MVVDKNNNLPDEWYPLCDQYGQLWLTNYAGAIRYDGCQFLRITDPTRTQTMCLFEDPARNLILKGGENQVLFIENKPPFRFTRFDLKSDDNATDTFVQVIRKDPQGFYWFGGHHLTHYDYDRKKATVYTPIHEAASTAYFFSHQPVCFAESEPAQKYDHTEKALTLINGQVLYASCRGGQDLRHYLNQTALSSEGSLTLLEKIIRKLLG